MVRREAERLLARPRRQERCRCSRRPGGFSLSRSSRIATSPPLRAPRATALPAGPRTWSAALSRSPGLLRAGQPWAGGVLARRRRSRDHDRGGRPAGRRLCCHGGACHRNGRARAAQRAASSPRRARTSFPQEPRPGAEKSSFRQAGDWVRQRLLPQRPAERPPCRCLPSRGSRSCQPAMNWSMSLRLLWRIRFVTPTVTHWQLRLLRPAGARNLPHRARRRGGNGSRGPPSACGLRPDPADRRRLHGHGSTTLSPPCWMLGRSSSSPECGCSPASRSCSGGSGKGHSSGCRAIPYPPW